MIARVRRAIRRAWWLPVAIPTLLTGASWLIQVLVAGDFPNWARVSLIVAGTLSAILAFALPTRQLFLERRSRAEDVASYRLKLHDILIPVAMKVGDAINAPNAAVRREAQISLRQMVVDFAAVNIGPERSRACLYELLSNANPHDRLERKAWHGRNKEPRQRFEEGTPEATHVFTILREMRACLVEDAAKAGLPGWNSTSEYKTFICAAVFAGGRQFGILTVDSPAPNDLGEDDRDLVRLLAQLLASGLAAK